MTLWKFLMLLYRLPRTYGRTRGYSGHEIRFDLSTHPGDLMMCPITAVHHWQGRRPMGNPIGTADYDFAASELKLSDGVASCIVHAADFSFYWPPQVMLLRWVMRLVLAARSLRPTYE